jgi:hypothetical protein
MLLLYLLADLFALENTSSSVDIVPKVNGAIRATAGVISQRRVIALKQVVDNANEQPIQHTAILGKPVLMQYIAIEVAWDHDLYGE